MDALQELLTGIKKIPTAIAGGPVDLANLILGAATGKGLAGISEKPVGGSAWLNEKFGIQGGGLISDAVEMVGSSVNPASMGKSLAVLVPAIVTKEANTILKAQRALKKGADPAEVFADTGIYQHPTGKDLMSVIPDTDSKLRLSQFDIDLFQGMKGPEMMISHPMSSTSALEDVLYHPELYARIPDLKDINVGRTFDMPPNSAAYYPKADVIDLGTANTPIELQSILLHEVQHAIQTRFDLPGGGNTSMFFQDRKAFDEASEVIRNLRHEITDRVKAGAIPKEVGESLKDSVHSWSDLLRQASSQANKNYLALTGEAEARLVEDMFMMGPESSKIHPLIMMENELATYGLDPTKLRDPSNKPRAVDQDPVIQAIISFAKEQKRP